MFVSRIINKKNSSIPYVINIFKIDSLPYLFSLVIQLADPQDNPHRNASLIVAREIELALVSTTGVSIGGVSTASHHRINVPVGERGG